MSKENVLFQVEEDDIETTAPEDEARAAGSTSFSQWTT